MLSAPCGAHRLVPVNPGTHVSKLTAVMQPSQLCKAVFSKPINQTLTLNHTLEVTHTL